ncbi:hypothetical protein AWB64_04784 [Caballeronia sordidicola]|uniref:Uncharacterized protein n=1 Tax=Caballeronia sordidicola TaxID=196367 RepID=A0A158HL46_CABSO|nr:alkaline shock response membrane anchor protein AmaP [Caballeronia sordidicola]SAL45128.1 hypothetical protein AWB64_04784 [Caballeronia sordidicola]
MVDKPGDDFVTEAQAQSHSQRWSFLNYPMNRFPGRYRRFVTFALALLVIAWIVWILFFHVAEHLDTVTISRGSVESNVTALGTLQPIVTLTSAPRHRGKSGISAYGPETAFSEDSYWSRSTRVCNRPRLM